MEWSKYFQNAEFLEKTRMGMLLPEYRELMQRFIGLKDGCRILDIGCGTGVFGAYLAEGLENVSVTGLDMDEGLLAYAQENLPRDKFMFVCADAAALPFEAESFDAVVSHTFLTSMPLYKQALAEMARVCKTGGTVASLAGMSLSNVPTDGGVYPPEWTWKKRYDELLDKLWGLYQALVPYQQFARGADAGRIPLLFSEAGFENVGVLPVGSFWSLSNSAVPREKRLRYIELDCAAEIKRMEAVASLPGAEKYMSEKEREEMKELLVIRREALKDSLDGNCFWEWSGNGNLLVTGRKR